jgi:helicase
MILRAKKASACLLWMSAHPRAQVERVVLQHGGGFTAAGPIQSVASRTCDVLPVVARTAEILHPELDLSQRVENLLVCLEIGLPPDLGELGLAAGRTLNRAASGKSNDRRYGGHFVLRAVLWWATLDSNQ